MAYLRSAIAITTGPSERLELLLKAGRSANAAAHQDEAEALAREAIDLAESVGDPAAVGEGQALLGEILIDAGSAPEAVAVLEAAVAAFPDGGPDHVRAGILADLSRAFMRTGQSLRSIAAADLALDLAEHLDLGRVLAETLNNKGSSLNQLGRHREGNALLQTAVDVAREGGHVTAEIRALANLAANLDDLRQAQATQRQAADLAMRVGNRSMGRWAAESARFCSYLLAEGWDEALAAGADDPDDPGGSPMDEVRRLSITGDFLAARGEPTDDLLQRLDGLATRISDPMAVAMARFLRSDRALMTGDYGASADDAIAAADADLQAGDIFLALAMRPLLWARDLDRARLLLVRLETARRTDAYQAAERIAARAGVAGLEGRVEEAVAGYRDALARARAMGAGWQLAMIGLDFVTVVGADHPATRTSAAEARAIFERVRARPLLERLDALMAPAAHAPDRQPARSSVAANQRADPDRS